MTAGAAAAAFANLAAAAFVPLGIGAPVAVDAADH